MLVIWDYNFFIEYSIEKWLRCVGKNLFRQEDDHRENLGQRPYFRPPGK